MKTRARPQSKPAETRKPATAEDRHRPGVAILRALAVPFAILAVTALVYSPAFNGPWIWDDDSFLIDNPLIKVPGQLWKFWFTRVPIDYFPLTSTMLWVEWRLFGDDPTGYHIINIVLHAINAIVLWRILLRIKIPGAALVGFLFALHPVNAASVAWITERKNTLSMFFYLLSVLAYVRFIPSEQYKWYALSLLAFLAALFSKSSVVMAPIALLLITWWMRSRITRRDVALSVPFFALSLLIGLITVWFQSNRAIAGMEVRPEGWPSRIAASGWCLWFYLYKAFVPLNLAMIYPRWHVNGANVLSYLPGLLFVSMAGVLWWKRQATWARPVLFALLYFAAMLFPVLGFFKMAYAQHSFVADHLSYLAIIGPLTLIGATLWQVCLRSNTRAAFAIPVLLLAVFSALTFREATLYQDTEKLWTQTLKVNPWTSTGYNNRGVVRVAKKAEDPKKLDEGIADYDQALRLDPKNPLAWNNRGVAWHTKGEEQKAFADYCQAIKVRPNYPEAHNNRGLYYRRQGKTEEAIKDYSAAIELRPDFAEALNNRGSAYTKINEFKKAADDFTKALYYRPKMGEGWNNMAVASFRLGNYELAWNCVRKAEQLGTKANPNFLKELTEASRKKQAK